MHTKTLKVGVSPRRYINIHLPGLPRVADVPKVLSVQNEVTKLSKVIILRGAWLDSLCVPGSYVHLIGAFDQYGQCIVDDVENLIILHPDHLISATVVGDSFECTRKAVLQDRVKATSDSNQSTTYGHMLHEIFQAAMKANRWDVEWMNTTIESIAARHLEDLFGLNIELVIAVEHLQARVIDLQAWAEIFIAAKPKVSHSVLVEWSNFTESWLTQE